jgi:hypothetical protein
LSPTPSLVSKRQPQRLGQTNDQPVVCERREDLGVTLPQRQKKQLRDSPKIQIVGGHPVVLSVR